MSINYNLFLTSCVLHPAHMASFVNWSVFPRTEALIFEKRHTRLFVELEVWVIFYFNPLVPHAPFLYPLKTSENLTTVFGATSITIFHGKRQFDVLGGWVSKDILIMTFCVTKWFPENPISKQKILWTKIKKSHPTHVCFPF